MLIRVQPRYKVSGITLHSGSVYKSTWTYPRPRGVKARGVSLTLGSSASLSAGQYWFDTATSILYMRGPSSENLITSSYLTATFDIYHSTIEQNWFRDPTDDTSEEVFWHGDILESPEVSISAMSKKYGFVTLDSTGFSVALAQDIVNQTISAGSYNKAKVEVWHLVGEANEPTNYVQIFTGQVNGQITCTLTSASFELTNSVDKLSGEIPSKLVADIGSDVDGRYANARMTCFMGYHEMVDSGVGRRRGTVGVCIDYEDDAPTTSDNRNWIAFYANGDAGTNVFQSNAETTYSSGFAPSVKNLGLSVVKKYRVGDIVQIDPTSGTTIWTKLNSVNYSTGDVGLDDTPDSGGGNIRKGFARNVYLVQSGMHYTLRNLEDYACNYDSSSGCNLITLSSVAESNAGASTLNPGNGDYVIIETEGWPEFPTISGSPIADKDPNTSVEDVFIWAYWYVKHLLGIAETDIDTAAFNSLQASKGTNMSRYISPTEGKQTTAPSRIEVYDELLNIAECISFIDESGKVTIKDFSELASSGLTIDLEEMDAESWEYAFDYRDIRNKREIYNVAETVLKIPKSAALAGDLSSTATEIIDLKDVTEVTTDEALYLHEESSFTEGDQYFSNRRGLLSCSVPFKVSASQIGNVVTVTSTRMPGYAITSTVRSRDFIIRSITWSLEGTKLVLEDLYEA